MARSIRDDLQVTTQLRTQQQVKLQHGLRVRGVESLEQEFLSEIASSLKRAEDKILSAYEACNKALALLEASAPTDAQALKLYNAGCERVRIARWEMIVHREAVGLRDGRLIRELYPLPAKRSFGS